MNKNNSSHYEKVILALVDSTCVFFGFVMTFGLFSIINHLTILDGIDTHMILLLSVTSIVSFHLFNAYNDWRRKSKQHLTYTVVLAMLLYSTVLFSLTLLNLLPVAESFVAAAFIIQTLFLVFVRISIWSLIKRLYGNKRVLIIGSTSEEGLQLANKILNHCKGWFVVNGLLTIKKKNLMKGYINHVDVLLLSPELTQEEKVEMTKVGIQNGKEVILIPDLFELFVYGAKTQQIDDTLVFSIQPPKICKVQQIAKRIMDVSISCVVLAISSPILLLLYMLIPITSKGPALFLQERIGLDEKPFKIYKFRSMVQDAEKQTGPVLATEKDTRITPVGKFIRATRLDELPQLFNVLRGEMSLIGPRPEREFFIKQYKHNNPDYSYRLTVKPGITGLAQVLANYSTTADDKLRYDLMYVRTYSLTLDIKILLQTIRVVLQRNQAKGVEEDNMLKSQQLLQMQKQNQVMN